MQTADLYRRVEEITHACRKHNAGWTKHVEEGRFEPLVAIAPPATEAAIASVESELGMQLPDQLRRLVSETAASANIVWYLPDGLFPPDPFGEIFSGEIFWSLEALAELEANRRSWIDSCFPDPSNAYDRIWHDKLSIAKVGNGDMIAIDLVATANPVVYLSHDDGDGHGCCLAPDLMTYVEGFTTIGCPGLEDWQWLPFVSDPTSGIDAMCALSREWRRWFGMEGE